MMEKKAYIAPSTTLPNIPVTFTDACIGCNTCVNVCRTDVLLPKQNQPAAAAMFRAPGLDDL